MADENPVQGLCEETTCSICLEYFKDPVIIDCGHIFCQACITRCWREYNRNVPCPQCRKTVQQRNFRPVRQLVTIVEIAKKFSLQMAKEAEAWGTVCEQHQEPLKLFCRDDEVPICVVCDKSKEHHEHKVIPKEEAVEEYKGKLQTLLTILKKERGNMLSSQQSGETEGRDLLKQTEKERQKITAEFKQLHKFLEEEEHGRLAELKALDEQVKDWRNAHIARLRKDISAVDLLIKEMEAKQKQPASEFLQDIRSILQRCNEQKFVNVEVFPLELKEQIKKFSEINNFLGTVMKKFKESVFTGPQTNIVKEEALSFQLLKQELPTDNKRAIPTLVQSMNCKTRQVSNTISNQYFYQYHNKCSCWAYVMGVEKVNSGRWSWVVNVKYKKFWAVGVALELCRGYDVSNLCPEKEIWAVGKSADNTWYAFTSSGKDQVLCPLSSNWNHALRLHHCNETTIRVSLDYEAGSVEFSYYDHFNYCRTLYIFQNASFYNQPISSWFIKGK
ncbi:zinc finger protein RFP-like [Eublepharis macularius]|uniref:Zinc finger protein RFP-like n=1 Tax=Eublepharis macularius TaxID=481883 RepID=A0AA97KXA9_EUBMA|nr:zinc finger protein RFP-like [Eublepharis macularius]